MSTRIDKLRADLKKFVDKDRSKKSGSYFKTNRGGYAEEDKFLGVKTPDSRKVAKKYSDLNLKEIQQLLDSEYHEERFIALVILNKKYQKSDDLQKQEIFDFYLKNTQNVNNWDLVDISSYKIVGRHLLNRDRKVLYSLSGSSSLWERRISIVATYEFIRNDDYRDTIKIAKRLLRDKEDLIHKAVGWMLREVGKRDKEILDKFLEKNYHQMPRTMLRYAIEKHPERERQKILMGNV